MSQCLRRVGSWRLRELGIALFPLVWTPDSRAQCYVHWSLSLEVSSLWRSALSAGQLSLKVSSLCRSALSAGQLSLQVSSLCRSALSGGQLSLEELWHPLHSFTLTTCGSQHAVHSDWLTERLPSRIPSHCFPPSLHHKPLHPCLPSLSSPPLPFPPSSPQPLQHVAHPSRVVAHLGRARRLLRHRRVHAQPLRRHVRHRQLAPAGDEVPRARGAVQLPVPERVPEALCGGDAALGVGGGPRAHHPLRVADGVRARRQRQVRVEDHVHGGWREGRGVGGRGDGGVVGEPTSA